MTSLGAGCHPILRRLCRLIPLVAGISVAWSAAGQNTAYVRDSDESPSTYLSPADATFTATKNYDNGVSIDIGNFNSPGAYISHRLDFAAPGEQPLTVGVYNYATRFPFQEPNEPGLSVSGNGSGCNTLTGSFEVKQIVYGAGNAITSFHATFVQYCEGFGAPSTGEILFNASAPVPQRNRITSPSAAFSTRGQPFKYKIRGSNSPGSYTASGLPAGLTVNTSTGWITGTPLVEGDFVVALTATGTAGTASGSLNLHVDPPQRSTGPHTSLFVKSEPGDFVGQGQTHLHREYDGYFSVRPFGTSGAGFSFRSPGYTNLWQVHFYAAEGQPLTTGRYEGAKRFESANNPGLSVGGNGNGCNQSTGHFEIIEYTRFNDTVLTFRARFTQFCDGSTAPLQGEIWYKNSSAITSNPSATATRNTPFEYQIVANNSATSYGASGLPPGLSVDSATGIISGVPTITGKFSVLLTAAGNTSTAAGRVILTIAPPSGSPAVPVITSPDRATTVHNQPFNYAIAATNSPVQFGASGLPPGLTVNPSTGVISGTPTAIGTFDAIITATNAAATGGSSLTLTVNPPPPAITSSSSAVADHGKPFNFQVTATNNPTQYAATGLPQGLSIDSVSGNISGTPAQEGAFSVVLFAKNNGGTGSQNFNLTVNPPPPTITSASTATAVRGQNFTYQITATANPTSYGASGLPSGLSVNTSTGFISGVPQQTGTTQVTLSATNEWGTGSKVLSLTVNSSPTPSPSPSATPTPSPGPAAQLANISTRLNVGRGENVLIGGFIITGNEPKKVIVRAIAPSLKADGAPVQGALADPVLELFDGNEKRLALNDDWRDTQQDEVNASTIPPTDDRESAIVALLTPGNYTAITSGKNGSTGIALVEVYDLDTGAKSKVVNVSSRGLIESGDALIGGLIVTGAGNHRTIIRAIGPSLAAAGVERFLENPSLELYGSNGEQIARNEDWKDSQEFDLNAAGFNPPDDRESAIIASFPAGIYTAVVRGSGSGVGVAVVEVYSVP